MRVSVMPILTPDFWRGTPRFSVNLCASVVNGSRFQVEGGLWLWYVQESL